MSSLKRFDSTNLFGGCTATTSLRIKQPLIALE